MWDFPTEDSLLGPRLVGTAGGTAVTFLMLRRSSIAPRLVGGGVPALAVVFYDRIRRDISLRARWLFRGAITRISVVRYC